MRSEVCRHTGFMLEVSYGTLLPTMHAHSDNAQQILVGNFEIKSVRAYEHRVEVFKDL